MVEEGYELGHSGSRTHVLSHYTMLPPTVTINYGPTVNGDPCLSLQPHTVGIVSSLQMKKLEVGKFVQECTANK